MTTIGGTKVNYISKSKKVRNAEWIMAMLDNGKYALFMNCRLQRIFSTFGEAETWFEIETSI